MTAATPDLVGALGSSFESMSYKSYSSTTDWNTYTAGIYYVAQSTSFSSDYNQPVGAYPYGILIVFSNNGNNLTNLYIAHSTGHMWFRERWSSSNDFSSWTKVITNADIGNQSVNYANSAGSSSTSVTAANVGRNTDTSVPMSFWWSGKGGQPTWLWGGEDGSNMYVYNPANFRVNYANSSGVASYVNGGVTIDSNYASKFRTELTGSKSTESFVKPIRNDTGSVDYSPQYGAGIAFGRADTHGYLYMSYSGPYAYLGAGNGDVLNWRKQIAFTDSKVSSASYADSAGTASTLSNPEVVSSSTEPTNSNCKIWIKI